MCCDGAVVVGGWDAWAVVRECALEVVAAAVATTFVTTTTTNTTIITITINTHFEHNFIDVAAAVAILSRADKQKQVPETRRESSECPPLHRLA